MIIVHSAPITVAGLVTPEVDIDTQSRVNIYVNVDDYLTSLGFYIEPRLSDGSGFLARLGAVIPATVTLIANTCINVEMYPTRFNFTPVKHPTTIGPFIFSIINPGLSRISFACVSSTNDTGDVEIGVIPDKFPGFILP